MFSQFLIKFSIWTLSFFCILFFSILIARILDFQWLFDFSPSLYYSFRDFFHFFFYGKFFLVFLFFLWMTGNFVLVYRLVKKLSSYIEDISQASSLLFSQDVDYIELPTELEEIQKQFHRLKQNAEKNEKLAREQEEKKNDLIVYLAHDLKTPLTSLIGYLSLLEEIKDMPKKQREKYIQIALEKSCKLEDLINELFEIARFNSEKIILDPDDVHLNLMLEQLIDDFYPVLQEKKKKIVMEASDSIHLMVDPNQMARVFSNLFQNAIFYSSGEEIKVHIEIVASQALIVVSNVGKKIPQEKLNHIFEKFYRADSSRSLKTGNSGLGLSIAKEIVLLHGGTIWATSDDKYTSFYVSLPLSN